MPDISLRHKRHFANIPLVSLRPPLIILCLLPALAHASNEYICPLIGNYVVIRRDTRAMCYLAEVYNAQNSFGGHEILGHVEEIAVAGTLITGKANNQYFLLNTAQPDAAPEIFATAEQWNSALKAMASRHRSSSPPLIPLPLTCLTMSCDPGNSAS